MPRILVKPITSIVANNAVSPSGNREVFSYQAVTYRPPHLATFDSNPVRLALDDRSPFSWASLGLGITVNDQAIQAGLQVRL
jgi:hypothetical protein